MAREKYLWEVPGKVTEENDYVGKYIVFFARTQHHHVSFLPLYSRPRTPLHSTPTHTSTNTLAAHLQVSSQQRITDTSTSPNTYNYCKHTGTYLRPLCIMLGMYNDLGLSYR